MKRLLSFAIVTLALVAAAQAQYRPSGPPASVITAQPNPVAGAPLSGPGATVTSGTFTPVFPQLRAPRVHRRHGNGEGGFGGDGRGRFGTPFAPIWASSPTLIPVPVPVDANGVPVDVAADQAEEEDDRPALTVFGHRSRTALVPTYSDDRRYRRAEATPAPEPAPVQEQPATLLIFRDGHQLEITNYAIQSGTLFNLSDNGPRKIALADLDVDRTVKANDERGVDFTLPTAR